MTTTVREYGLRSGRAGDRCRLCGCLLARDQRSNTCTPCRDDELREIAAPPSEPWRGSTWMHPDWASVFGGRP